LDKVEINGHLINYATAGSGEPLLLLHGGNIGWGQWYPNIPELAKHYRVYALDLPGAGRSSRIDFAKLDLNQDLVEVAEKFIALKGLRRSVVIGASAGGWIAAQLALRDPEIISKIVLVDAVGLSGHFSFTDRVLSFYRLMKFVSKTLLSPERENRRVEAFLRGAFFSAAHPLRQEFIEYFYETMRDSHNLLFISRLAQHVVKGDLALMPELPKIKSEALIVWGEQDRLMPLEKCQPNFSLLSRAKVSVIKNAGHMPSLEKPEEFNSAVIAFLQNGISFS
jgi:pimeloyl-ACP methyl ester carboxylesterase